MPTLNKSYLSITLLAFTLISCNGSDAPKSGNQEKGTPVVPSVEAVMTRFGSLPLEERLSGVVWARNQVELNAEISGPLVEVLVNNGDFVEKGQLLARIRDRDFTERLRQAESGLRIARARVNQVKSQVDELEANARRTKQLAEKDLVSNQNLEVVLAQLNAGKANLELAEAQVEQAQSQVDEQREILRRTAIVSPISGYVGERNAEIGMQVSPTTRLFTIGDLSNVIVRTSVTERMLGYIRVGQTALISSEAQRENIIRAEINRISPFLNPTTHSTDIEMDVLNPNLALRPGMFVTIDVLYGESENATLIPLSALYKHPITGVEGVYVVPGLGTEIQAVNVNAGDNVLTEPQGIEFVPARVVARGRALAGVAGIKPNSWIITLGQNLLVGNQNQAKVRPIDWDRIINLQAMQRQELLREILEKQQQRRDSINQQATKTSI